MKRRYPAKGPRYPVPGVGHHLIAVDLGKTKVGVSVFWVGLEGAALVRAFTLAAERGSTPKQVALLVRAEIFTPLFPAVWVCEWPKKYDYKRKQHKDLDSLHEVGYALAQLHGGWAEMYLPGEWKGNVPKTPHHKRIERALTPDERALMPPKSDHDAWDAVGIGLFATGRTKRGGTL